LNDCAIVCSARISISRRFSMRVWFRLLAVAAAGLAASLAVPVSASNAAAPQTAHSVSPVSAQPDATAISCTLTAVGDGVRIRTAPHNNATVVGEAFRGQRFTDPGCTSVQGDTYTACGGHENFWVKIVFQGVTRYSAAACYTNA
jgi:hypothetical protein